VQRHRDALAVEHQPDLEPHRACSCPCMAAIANYPVEPRPQLQHLVARRQPRP
jgi:hypothetical protein